MKNACSGKYVLLEGGAKQAHSAKRQAGLLNCAVALIFCVIVLLAPDQCEAVSGASIFSTKDSDVFSLKDIVIADKSDEIKRIKIAFVGKISLTGVRIVSNILPFQRDNAFKIRFVGVNGLGHLAANEPLVKIGQESWSSSPVNQPIFDGDTAAKEGFYRSLATRSNKTLENLFSQIEEYIRSLKINQCSFCDVSALLGGISYGSGVTPKQNSGYSQYKSEQRDRVVNKLIEPIQEPLNRESARTTALILAVFGIIILRVGCALYCLRGWRRYTGAVLVTIGGLCLFLPIIGIRDWL